MAKMHELKQNVAAHDPSEHNDLNGAQRLNSGHGELVEPLERTGPRDERSEAAELKSVSVWKGHGLGVFPFPSLVCYYPRRAWRRR